MWDMDVELNDMIPLIDDTEPLRGDSGWDDESEEALQMWHYIAVTLSLGLTFILIVLWPIPMYFSGVFGGGLFTFWVMLSILFIVIAALIILGLPLVEIYNAIFKERATRALLATAEVKSVLDKAKIPPPLTCTIVGGADCTQAFECNS